MTNIDKIPPLFFARKGWKFQGTRTIPQTAKSQNERKAKSKLAYLHPLERQCKHKCSNTIVLLAKHPLLTHRPLVGAESLERAHDDPVYHLEEDDLPGELQGHRHVHHGGVSAGGPQSGGGGGGRGGVFISIAADDAGNIFGDTYIELPNIVFLNANHLKL